MIEFGLFPNFVTTRQIKVRLPPCHSRLIAPCAVSLWILAQPCGRPGRWCSVGIKPSKLRISHDLFPQGSTPGRNDLNHGLHFTPSFSRKSVLLQCFFSET